MAATVIDYVLLAMYFVCNSVAPGNNSGISSNVTSPVAPQLQPLPQPMLKARRPPAGYDINPDVGFAYKLHHVSDKGWIQARSICLTEGAQLAVLDSAEKMDYMNRYMNPNNFIYAGIICLNGVTCINVNTGVPVTSIIWASRGASGIGECLYFYTGIIGLWKTDCDFKTNFFCEFKITENPATADSIEG